LINYINFFYNFQLIYYHSIELTYEIVWNYLYNRRVTLRYWLNRREFNRRTSTGMQAFKSYERARVTRLLEGLGKILGLLLIFGGGILILLSFVRPYGMNIQGHH
jgi:hypothetical protein